MSNTSPNIVLRPATVADVPQMGRIINDCAEYGLMLPRSQASLYENVRDFHVAVQPGGNDDARPLDQVVGVCALSVIWANLAEIAALAVIPQMRGHGLGRQLVEACLDAAADLGIARVMTLTYEGEFFRRLGFATLDRKQLPLKVWSQCIGCPKNQACDEIAMVRVLEHVPRIVASQPESPPSDQYVVPVVLSSLKSRLRD